MAGAKSTSLMMKYGAPLRKNIFLEPDIAI
jgi:hypothetical protein